MGGSNMSLDFSHGGYENLFKQALQNGINLFCGAGFSVEAEDKNGAKLPVGDGLFNELKEKFESIKPYKSLPRACTKLVSEEKEEFYSFLRSRFSVAKYDPLYNSLSKVNLKNIYTTNIDDLFFKIFDGIEANKYLNDASEKGRTYNDKSSIDYYPLHGCVRKKGGYVFGATELASAFSNQNATSWRMLAKDSSKDAFLFWGWNFNDPGPLEAMYGNNNDIDNNIKRWVLLYEPSEEALDYLTSQKFNIIIGDTRSMLSYIDKVIRSNDNIFNEDVSDVTQNLKEYTVPSPDNVISYPLETFFLGYSPRWSHIYSRTAKQTIPKTENYKKIADNIAAEKDIVVLGIRASGKTTLMMQLLAYYDSAKLKHQMVGPSYEEVALYLKRLGNHKSLLFVDDCFRDTDAISALMSADNVQVVAFDRDFSYEQQFHRIKSFPFEAIDVTEITQRDAQEILDIIPEDLRRKPGGTTSWRKDPTILNLLAKNIKSKNFKFFNAFLKDDSEAARVFLMIAYVHSCGTPCSFDMVYSFLGDDYTIPEKLGIVNRLGGLIKDPNFQDTLQDYYQCRSRFLAEKIIESIPDGNEIFSDMLIRFTECVLPYKICQYDKFKRTAYDSNFATRAFPEIEDGESFYNLCIKKDESEYIYQQAAIYFSKKSDYKKAFNWIDKARSLSHYNRFSIDSTYAQISFKANLSKSKELSEEAIDILDKCCTNDKRKSIHFLAFASCCMEYYKKYSDNKYIPKALKYVNEGLDSKNRSLSSKNKHALKNLKSRLEDCLNKSL